MSMLTVPTILANKMRVALWSVDSLDWKLDPSDQLIARMKKLQPGPGDVVLLHDDYIETVNALPQILMDIQARGLQCVNLDQLI